MDIEANLDEYLKSRSPNDRYASFDYCFNYFQARADDVDEIVEGPNLEISCLQLGFYLASWGMYRGSTVLLKRSLAYLADAVRVIGTSPTEIWSTDANSYSTDACAVILDVGQRLRDALPGASETLVTKIMLGTFGCVPAFDTYFCRAFRVWAFDRVALGRIGRFYQENAEFIEHNRPFTLDFATGLSATSRYSRAKVIDMIFFIEGVHLASIERAVPDTHA